MEQNEEKVIPAKPVLKPIASMTPCFYLQAAVIFSYVIMFLILFIMVDMSGMESWAKLVALFFGVFILIDARRASSALFYCHGR